jgi:putative ABC transport system permease protein
MLSTTFTRDIALALRLLARRPGFAATAILTLALGVGAPTAIFSVVRAVLLRPLPYPDADRILRFRIESNSPAGAVAFDALPASEALDWAARSATLSAMALFNDRAMTLQTPEGPFRVSGVTVTPNLFETLGVVAAAGRTFRGGDADPREIVLSHAMWTRFFNADVTIVNTPISMDGTAFRVVGIMSKTFAFPTPDAAFWVPVSLTPGGTRGMLLPAIARMRAGVTIDAVLQEGREALGGTGDARVTQTLLARTLKDQIVGPVRGVLWMLLGAVGFVLIIATVNISLLLLTRGAGREREFAVRLALGAGRGRLIRQLFVEGLTLGAIGGVAGIGLSWLALELLLQLAPADLPRLADATLDRQVLLFALALTLTTSLVFGMLSAGRTLATDLVRGLTGRGASRLAGLPGPSRRRLGGLAAAEIALTMVLLAAAGWLLRSVVAKLGIDQGFDTRGAMAMQISLPPPAYPTPEARVDFHRRLLERLELVPGIDAVGLAVSMPNRQPTGRFDLSAEPITGPPEPFSTPVAEVRMVSEGFAEAMGLRLIAGRVFRPEDRAGAEEVIVISEQLARQRFPDGAAIGRLLYSRTGDRRVIGVVADVRPLAPGQEVQPAAYLSLWQNPDVLQWFAGVHIVARGSDVSSLAPVFRRTVLALDPAVPPFNVRTLGDDVARVVAGPRFAATLLALFAGVALVMVAIAVYGVMAYAARLRTREIGLRIALGSTRAQALRLIARDGAVAVAMGVASGLVAAGWLAKSVASLLPDVSPADPLSLVWVAALLAAVGLGAVLIPARRAAWNPPMEAIRGE